MSVDVQRAKEAFCARYECAPQIIVRAPGRVNIIGEHTDYNHGFVLPMAIERETVILARPRQDRHLRAYSVNFDRTAAANLDDRSRNRDEPWMDYVMGVADQIAKLGLPLRGADLLIVGDVPIGAGLSSSASIEMAALALFEQLGGFLLEGAEGPKLGRRVENEFLGVNSGIMDQFIARFAEAGHALFLDCRSLDYELVPVAIPGATFVIANTGVSRGLTASKYNERVAECAQATEVLREHLGRDGTHLRDFTPAELDACRERLLDSVYRRARHVITENARTLDACLAMRAGNAAAVGRLMNESDASLREDYEVTSDELDAMTSLARSIQGCYGARMTGAGFGGCTISLVTLDRVGSFAESLLSAYRRCIGLEGEVIISDPAPGAGVIACEL